MHLTDLDHEVTPFLIIIGKKTAFLVFLCDSHIGNAVRIFSTFEIMEIRLRKKLVLIATFILELLSGEDVLLVNGISFSQSRVNGSKQMGVFVVAVNIGSILLDRVL